MNYDNDVFFEKGQFVQVKGYVKAISKLHWNVLKFLKI